MAGGTITTFINPQYLRDNSILNDNIDAKVLQPIIRQSQDKYIQQTIGTKLYETLIAMVVAANPALMSPTPIPTDYIILIEEYIIPVLVQYTVWEAIPFLNYKFRNKAIGTQGSDNTTPATLDEVNFLRDNVLSTAQFYAERMTQYLLFNTSLYPEYLQYTNDLKANTQSYFNGIHIPRRKGRLGSIGWDRGQGWDGYYGGPY